MIELLKVKTTSKPNLVATAIANILRNQKKLNIQAVGAGSINQAVKALAIARSHLVLRGNPACRGTFGGRRKAVRDRLALQGGTGDFP